MFIHLDDIDNEVTKALKNVETARAHLVEVVQKASPARLINDQVIALAEAEGTLWAVRSLQQALIQEGSSERVPDKAAARRLALTVTLELLAQGPEDTWSGRSNDVRRARYDGILSVVRDVKHELTQAIAF